MHSLSEVLRESCRRFRPEHAAENTEEQSHKGHDEHDQACPYDIVHIRSADSEIDDPSHKDRNDHLTDDLSDHTHRCKNSCCPEFSDVL